MAELQQPQAEISTPSVDNTVNLNASTESAAPFLGNTLGNSLKAAENSNNPPQSIEDTLKDLGNNKIDIDAEAAKLVNQYNATHSPTPDATPVEADTPLHDINATADAIASGKINVDEEAEKLEADAATPPPPEIPSSQIAPSTPEPSNGQTVEKTSENTQRTQPEDKTSTEAPISTEQVEAVAENKNNSPEQIAAKNMGEIMTTFEKYGIKLADKDTQNLIDALSKNPEMMNTFKSELAKAEEIGPKLTEAFKQSGINLSSQEALGMATGQILKQYELDIDANDSEMRNEDGSEMSTDQRSERKSKLSLMIKLLKMLGVVIVAASYIAVSSGKEFGKKSIS